MQASPIHEPTHQDKPRQQDKPKGPKHPQAPRHQKEPAKPHHDRSTGHTAKRTTRRHRSAPRLAIADQLAGVAWGPTPTLGGLPN